MPLAGDVGRSPRCCWSAARAPPCAAPSSASSASSCRRACRPRASAGSPSGPAPTSSSDLGRFPDGSAGSESAPSELPNLPVLSETASTRHSRRGGDQESSSTRLHRTEIGVYVIAVSAPSTRNYRRKSSPPSVQHSWHRLPTSQAALAARLVRERLLLASSSGIGPDLPVLRQARSRPG